MPVAGSWLLRVHESGIRFARPLIPADRRKEEEKTDKFTRKQSIPDHKIFLVRKKKYLNILLNNHFVFKCQLTQNTGILLPVQ